MSHLRNSKHLDLLRRRHTAKRATQRHVSVALSQMVLAMGMWFLGCASTSRTGQGASIDIQDATGNAWTLDVSRGRVVVLDLCVSSANACALNARILDEAQLGLAGESVQFLTVLLDEGPLGVAAVQSYANTLGLSHPVFLAGPRVRAGTSALGDSTYVPRLVILDVEGRIVLDDSGGVISVEGLVNRVRPLLPPRR